MVAQGVFLVPITPPFPFGHASCILFSAYDPNRDDWEQVRWLLYSPKNDKIQFPPFYNP